MKLVLESDSQLLHLEVGRAAVPYRNLRGAIGTFHAGKSADPSRKVLLHRSFLHRRSYAAVLHTLWWDAIGTSHTEKPANSSSKVTLHGNLLARIATQPALLLGVITATPCEKVEPVQRVSRQLDAPGGPSTSG